jgi:uncharacterized protein (TIGR00730 family)
MSMPHPAIESVCVYCGSSDAAEPGWLADASKLGSILATENLRLIYGGGGVGLMGACARAAHAAGGRVLGIIPDFLASREVVLESVETEVVSSMHERKIRMFEAADAFAVLPGAIGTLEEAVELLSWRRLGLHAKPIAFYNPAGFWAPLFDLFDRFIETRLVPVEFLECWRAVDRIEDVVPALRAMPPGPIISSVMRVVV